MGPRPAWSPRAPPKSVQRIVCAPSRPAPVGVTAGGLALVRTSGGVGLCDLRPGAPMLGAGMPDVPPGAAVPNPPSHRSAYGALSMFVCRTNPKAWQSGVLLRASGLGTALWRRE